MSRYVILCPRRADHGHRDRLWSFARTRWATLHPDIPIVEGHHDDGPFNRSYAVNRAAEDAGDWDAALIIDGDVLLERNAVLAALDLAAASDGPVLAYDHRNHWTARATEQILDGYAGRWDKQGMLKYVIRDGCSSAVAVSRTLWEQVGGFDELFSGWGWEDVAFRIAAEAVSGRELVKVASPLWHLWHPKSPENDRSAPTFRLNEERGARYKAARWDRQAIGALIDEHLAATGREKVVTAKPLPSREGSGIPKILHRTVPAETTAEVDGWWQKWADLHPEWTLMDHRDPLDPDDWPETGDLWGKCLSGAQRAGLIRLEALWRWGGVYVDSDVEPYRPLDSLLGLDGFAAWEDRRCVPDAVLGCRPGHPAVAVMLEKAREAVKAGARSWESGPGVTTAVLPGRPDWLLLPPGSFFPYHYKEKDRRDEDHKAAQPWSFGAHHWHHSWSGK